MPSTSSSSFSSDLPSSTVITPSLPTLSIASEMILPMLGSALAEMAPTCEISWASTVAVVVPSPATSEVLEATSFTICAPMFSNLSLSSISFATDTPSLVTVGAPNERSSTTLRPLGPSVTLTASARMFRPCTIRARAPSWKRTSFAGIAFLLYSLGCLCAFDDAHDVFLAHHEELLALDLDGLAGIFAEENLVAHLHVERDELALVILLAFADGDDFALVGLLGRGIRNHDATGGFALLFNTLDDHAVM